MPTRHACRAPDSRHRAARAAAAAAAVVLSAPVAWAQPVSDTPVDVDVRLVRSWFGPDAPLRVDVEVVNRSDRALGDLRVGVSLYRRVRSRSELDLAFRERLPRTPLVAPSFRVPDLAPAQRHVLHLEEDLASQAAFDRAPDGVYPVLVSVGRAGDEPVVRLATAVTYLAEIPVTPLRLLSVVTVLPAPLVRADGAETGTAARGLAAIPRRLDTLPVDRWDATAAISPLLLAELEVLRPQLPEEVAAAEASLRRVASLATLATVPYTNARLTDLSQLPTDVAGELTEGTAEIRRHLQTEPVPLMAPPELVLDPTVLDELKESGVDSVLVDGALLDGDGLTPGRAVRSAELTLVPTDRTLGGRVTRARTHLDVSRALADAAMVFFESPGRARTLAVVVDGLSSHTSAFLEGVIDSPWLQPEVSYPSPSTTGVSRSISWESPPPPPAGYRRALSEAQSAIETFAAFTLPDNPLSLRLRVAHRGAGGTAWWAGGWNAGRSRAEAVTRAVSEQRSLVEAGAAAPVTFTSRQGEVPVTVFNRAAYPVRVLVEVSSPKLQFPEGNRRVLDPLAVRGTTVTFPALAEATGTFPLEVTIRSADGRILLARSEVVVRSTAANVLALALTAGAGGFLVIWYGGRFVSARRPRA